MAQITLRLKRIDLGEKQTIGEMEISDSEGLSYAVLNTMELPWRNNEKRISCIPAGTYMVRPKVSVKFGECLEVLGVPDRDAILIHRGNYNSDTHGCILVGMGIGDINKDGLTDITDSKTAMSTLNSITRGAETIIIEITNGNETV